MQQPSYPWNDPSGRLSLGAVQAFPPAPRPVRSDRPTSPTLPARERQLCPLCGYGADALAVGSCPQCGNGSGLWIMVRT